MKHTFKDWILATRPWSLTASGMPALLAISYIYFIRNGIEGEILWWQGILALIGAVIFQVGGNLLNDYFDFVYKVDRADTHSSRILVDQIFSSLSVFTFGVSSLVAGSVIGLVLYLYSGHHLLWIGLLGFAGAYFYNRMKYIALGDLVIFIIYGLLIGLGVSYVMTGKLMWEMFLITSSPGLLIVAILHANNTRDILNDDQAKIKTQAMLFGVEVSKKYFIFLITGAYAVLLFNVFIGLLHPWCLITCVTFPMALKLMKQMNSVDINHLGLIKHLTESVAQLVMLFGLLLSATNFIIGFIR